MIIRKKIVAKPHQKRKAIRSQTQALSHLAGGMTQMIESQAKRHKALLEFERERDRNFMEFKRVEAEKTDNMNCRLLKYSHQQCTIKVFKGHLIPQTPTFTNRLCIKEKTRAEFLIRSLLLLHHVLNIQTNKCLLSIPREVKQFLQGIFFLTV